MCRIAWSSLGALLAALPVVAAVAHLVHASSGYWD